MSKHLSPREEKPSLSPLGAAAEPTCCVLGNVPIPFFHLFLGRRGGKLGQFRIMAQFCPAQGAATGAK